MIRMPVVVRLQAEPRETLQNLHYALGGITASSDPIRLSSQSNFPTATLPPSTNFRLQNRIVPTRWVRKYMN
jgi:hypothetical protein